MYVNGICGYCMNITRLFLLSALLQPHREEVFSMQGISKSLFRSALRLVLFHNCIALDAKKGAVAASMASGSTFSMLMVLRRPHANLPVIPAGQERKVRVLFDGVRRLRKTLSPDLLIAKTARRRERK